MLISWMCFENQEPKQKCSQKVRNVCKPVSKPITRTYRQFFCQKCHKQPPKEQVIRKPVKQCYYEDVKPDCKPQYQQECQTYPERQCQTKYKEVCSNEPKEVCLPHVGEQCRQKPLQECRMVDKQHCNPKKECTTKYEMKCEALPDGELLHYGYIQDHCDYKPVEVCKMVTTIYSDFWQNIHFLSRNRDAKIFPKKYANQSPEKNVLRSNCKSAKFSTNLTVAKSLLRIVALNTNSHADRFTKEKNAPSQGKLRNATLWWRKRSSINGCDPNASGLNYHKAQSVKNNCTYFKRIEMPREYRI